MLRKPSVRTITNAASAAVGEISMRGYIGESNQDYVDPWFGGTIEAWGAGTIKELEEEIKALDVAEIQIFITSEGGSVFDALTIADMLNRHPARIVTTVEGYAFSAATLLICKCSDEIRMAGNAYMMIHNASGGVCGTAEVIQRYATMLAGVSGTIAGTYAARGGPDAARFQALMDAESYLTGAECLSLKLADTLTDEVVLSNCRPIAATVRNVKTRERMPAAIKALFDTPAPSPAPPAPPEPTPPPADMTPEEIQALINTGITAAVTPLNEKIGVLETTNTAQAATLAAVEAENTRLSDLHKNGIPTASAGTQPITGAGGGNGSAKTVMNRAEWSALNPKARADFFTNGGKLTD